jgi:Mg-chelatase subunit ChlI
MEEQDDIVVSDTPAQMLNDYTIPDSILQLSTAIDEHKIAKNNMELAKRNPLYITDHGFLEFANIERLAVLNVFEKASIAQGEMQATYNSLSPATAAFNTTDAQKMMYKAEVVRLQRIKISMQETKKNLDITIENLDNKIKTLEETNESKIKELEDKNKMLEKQLKELKKAKKKTSTTSSQAAESSQASESSPASVLASDFWKKKHIKKTSTTSSQASESSRTSDIDSDFWKKKEKNKDDFIEYYGK